MRTSPSRWRAPWFRWGLLAVVVATLSWATIGPVVEGLRTMAWAGGSASAQEDPALRDSSGPIPVVVQGSPSTASVPIRRHGREYLLTATAAPAGTPVLDEHGLVGTVERSAREPVLAAVAVTTGPLTPQLRLTPSRREAIRDLAGYGTKHGSQRSDIRQGQRLCFAGAFGSGCGTASADCGYGQQVCALAVPSGPVDGRDSGGVVWADTETGSRFAGVVRSVVPDAHLVWFAPIWHVLDVFGAEVVGASEATVAEDAVLFRDGEAGGPQAIPVRRGDRYYHLVARQDALGEPSVTLAAAVGAASPVLWLSPLPGGLGTPLIVSVVGTVPELRDQEITCVSGEALTQCGRIGMGWADPVIACPRTSDLCSVTLIDAGPACGAGALVWHPESADRIRVAGVVARAQGSAAPCRFIPISTALAATGGVLVTAR